MKTSNHDKTSSGSMKSSASSSSKTSSTSSSKTSSTSSSKTSSDDSSFVEDLAPDGGWGWMVCFGSFMVNFILDGTMFSFGLILLELLDYFNESKGKAAWIGSVQLGLSMIFGPFIGWLLDRYTIRQVTIWGAVLASSGFITSFFAPSVDILILTYGVIGGMGFCMMFVPAIIVVGLYFTRKRAIATGIAMSGSGVGTFVYAYVTELLLRMFSWRGTVLILAGIVLNCVVCGALFRPLVSRRSAKNKKYYESAKHSDIENSDRVEKQLFLSPSKNSSLPMFFNSTSYLDKKSTNKGEIFPSRDKSIVQQFHRKYSSAFNLNRNAHHQVAFRQENPISRQDIYYSGSVYNVHQHMKSQDFQSFIVTMVQEIDDENITKQRSKWCFGCTPTFDKKLLYNSSFLLLLHCMVLWTAQSITLTYLPDVAIVNGLPRDQAAWLISVCGVTNTLGRILAGIVTDVFHVPSTYIYTCALVIASAVNFLIPWCESFASFSICAGIFGLCMACAVCLRTIIIADHLGIERLTSAFSTIAFFQGIAFIIDPPLAGFIYDNTSSYIYPFALSGGMYFLSSCLCIPLICKFRRMAIFDEKEIVVTSDNSSTDESLIDVNVDNDNDFRTL